MKSINYLKNLIENLLKFSICYKYVWYVDKKKKWLEQIKVDKDNIIKFIKLLNTISKKSKNWDLVYRVSLNPSIVNTSWDINKKFFENRINDLKDKILPWSEEKVLILKNTKQEFLNWVDKYLNYFLFKERFFNKEGKNTTYKSSCAIFFQEIEKYENKKDFKNYKDILKDFLYNNPITESINKDFQNLLEKFENGNVEENLVNEKVRELDFKNLNKLKYKLLWKKAEDKKLNKDVEKLKKYITEIKRQIRNRIEKDWSLYKKLLNEKKIKAQDYWQCKTEFIQKSNFDFENYGYDKFWLLIKWSEWKFYVYLVEKDNFKSELNKIEKSESWNDLIYNFESITPKWLYKLAFLKNAFDLVNKLKFWYSYKDNRWKEKPKSVKDIYDTKNKANYKDLNLLISYLKECINSEQWKKLFGKFRFDFREKYDNLSDFEKDILKSWYLVKTQKININNLNQDNLYKITLDTKKLESNKWLDLNILNLFLSWKYEQTRLLPEIKLYYREQSIQKQKEIRWKNKDWTDKIIIINKRYTKPTIRASFLFEINPLEISKSPEDEKKNFFNKLQNKKDDICYYWIDIWEKSFAMISRYDKDFKIIPIEVDLKQEQFLDLTNAKIENWKISINLKYKNDERYVFFKKFIAQIYEYQINLKEIFENIWNIDIWENYPKNIWDIKKLISSKIQIDELNYWNNSEFIKKYFKWFPWLTDFLLKFIKYYKDSNPDKLEINLNDFYYEIFKRLEFFKIVNYKEAFWSNFVWIIKHLIQEKPWIIVFENLWNNKIYDWENPVSKQKFENLSWKDRNIIKSFWAYVWNYIFQSVFNSLSKIVEDWKLKQYVYLDKNITKSLESESFYWSNWNVFWVKAEWTSTICPNCGQNINREKIDGEDKIYHDEKSPWKNNCWFFIDEKIWKTEIYNWIKFKNWDDLATYIIAMNWKKYFENPEIFEIKEERNNHFAKKKFVSKYINNKDYKNNNRQEPSWVFKRWKTLFNNKK